ncbi:MAG: hypothetical protein EPN23_09010 [Verrucomicrobia bacterium]|nr:MAG: hypothetical protein EPN23_09010 [Verrucomicrobiota bacterium]
MKKLLMVVLLASTVTAMAGKTSLVSDDSNAPWRMALKPEFQFSQLEGKFAGLAGVQLGPQLNETLYFGVGIYGLVNNIKGDNTPANDLSALDFWYGGFVADYTFFSDKLIHGSINALIGGGKVSPAGSDSVNVFVATPGISLMVNLTKQIELGVGAGYRFVAGADQPSDSDLSKPFASVFLRLNESY